MAASSVPPGLILVEDLTGTAPRLAASHWTKVADPRVCVVGVVGVDPAYQGLGLGRAVTILGLAHLQARDLPRVMLYVGG